MQSYPSSPSIVIAVVGRTSVWACCCVIWRNLLLVARIGLADSVGIVPSLGKRRVPLVSLFRFELALSGPQQREPIVCEAGTILLDALFTELDVVLDQLLVLFSKDFVRVVTSQVVQP